jgi:hypothetical protein
MMAELGQRRSERVLLDVPIVVCGESVDQLAFEEETFTVTVNAHGALLMLASPVGLGQHVRLINQASHEEREARVSYKGKGADHAGLSQVAVEFAQPSPGFWPVSPAPSSWPHR